MKLQLRYPVVLGTSVVAVVFSLIVSLLLVADFLGRGSYELFDNPKYLELKEQLQQSPSDPQVQQAIRELDLELRTGYFQHRRFMVHGVYLLIGGVALCLVTARLAVSLYPRLPNPRARDEEVDLLQRDQQWGRWAAVALVAAVLGFLCGYTLQADRILPASVEELAASVPARPASGADDVEPKRDTTADDPKKKPLPAPDGGAAQAKLPATTALPSYDEYGKQWPRFRGPTGSGVSTLADIPQQWSVENGEGILWKTAVPLPGPNSPVVWNKHVFVSGATPEQQAVFCFDAGSGELAWQLDVPVDLGGIEEFEVAEYTGYAAPTVATDGVRVYAIFATGNLVAADFQGQQLWRKNLGVPKNSYGHASSLATHNDLLIVQMDQGTAKDDKSKLMALQGATGDVAWEVTRPVPACWATPLVVRHDGRAMVITSADPCVVAYGADDGKELWRADCMSGEIGPSPVYADGVLYAANEACGMSAIRADGEGDVTKTHVEWYTDIDVPDVCTPLVADDYVILLSHGLLAAFDKSKADDPEESREPLWEEDLAEEISSSPARVGEFIYLFAEEGKAWILKPTRDACEHVAEFDMGEPVRSSPAFLPGRIYIRGEEHLFCIGK